MLCESYWSCVGIYDNPKLISICRRDWSFMGQSMRTFLSPHYAPGRWTAAGEKIHMAERCTEMWPGLHCVFMKHICIQHNIHVQVHLRAFSLFWYHYTNLHFHTNAFFSFFLSFFTENIYRSLETEQRPVLSIQFTHGADLQPHHPLAEVTH